MNDKIEFIVRKVRERDAEDIARYVNNRKIYENTQQVPYPYSIEDANAWIMKCLDSGYDKPTTFLHFIIEIDEQAVGAIGIEQMSENEIEMGYWLAEEYWGKGIMSRVVEEFSNYCFDKVGVERLQAGVFKNNLASKRILEKCEFEYDGERVAIKDGKEVEEFVYKKVKNG